jgi:hypothetical protein
MNNTNQTCPQEGFISIMNDILSAQSDAIGYLQAIKERTINRPEPEEMAGSAIPKLVSNETLESRLIDARMQARAIVRRLELLTTVL